MGEAVLNLNNPAHPRFVLHHLSAPTQERQAQHELNHLHGNHHQHGKHVPHDQGGGSEYSSSEYSGSEYSDSESGSGSGSDSSGDSEQETARSDGTIGSEVTIVSDVDGTSVDSDNESKKSASK